jgi:hypothetical protein
MICGDSTPDQLQLGEPLQGAYDPFNRKGLSRSAQAIPGKHLVLLRPQPLDAKLGAEVGLHHWRLPDNRQ